jgi:hypothetical protein
VVEEVEEAAARRVADGGEKDVRPDGERWEDLRGRTLEGLGGLHLSVLRSFLARCLSSEVRHL